MWGGVTTAAELRRIADVVDKYAIPTVKVTGGQRIDLLGVKKEDLPTVWARPRHALGPRLRQGAAHREDLRRLGMVPLRRAGLHADGHRSREARSWRMYAPHKVKLAVSRLPAQLRRVRHQGRRRDRRRFRLGDLRRRQRRHQDRSRRSSSCKVKTHDEVLEYSGAFLQLYREEGATSSAPCTTSARVGLDYVKKQGPRGRRRAARRCTSACCTRSRARRIRGPSARRRASDRVSSRSWRHESWTTRSRVDALAPVCALRGHPAAGRARGAARAGGR